MGGGNSARKGKDAVLFLLGTAQKKAWRQAHKKAVWIWQNQSKDATSKDVGPDLWFLFLGYPLVTFQPLDLFCSPSNGFQKRSPSQPGQSTESDPHE